MFWQFIDLIDFNITTLFISFILPFSYYAYTSAFWYDEERIKLFNFINLCLSILLITLVSFKIYRIAGSSDSDSTSYSLAALHYLVAFLSILTVFKNKSSSHLLIDSMLKSIDPTQNKEHKKTRPIDKKQIEQMTWDDIVIDEDLKEELNSIITLLKDPTSAEQYGINLPKGMLFNGPPGTGKTTIARVVASMSGLDFFVLQSNEIVSKWSGESEKNLSEFFEEASAHAPAIIFIDEVDAIAKSRSGSNSEHSDKLLNHLLQLIDGVIKRDGIYIIAATNRADLVDSALKRAGRLNRTIEIGLPTAASREKLFRLYTRKLKLAPDIDLNALAKMTENYCAADIKGICNQAGLYSYRREEKLDKQQKTFIITKDEMLQAIEDFKKTNGDNDDRPDQKHSEFLPQNNEIEKMGWDDIVIAKSLREELISVVKLLKDSDTAKKYGINVPKGILLDGPPGTGKTTIAKVMANTADMAFFVLQSNDVISKWVGESEKNLTRLFNAAAKYAPSIIFIDEIDSIAKNRSENNAQHADNLLNHLLQLIDGAIKRDGIYIIGATNRSDLVDPALKRGGRLTKTIYIPLPDLESVQKLLRIFLSKLTLEDGIDYDYFAQRCLGKSGADIRAICNQAGLNSFTRNSNLGIQDYTVTAQDIEDAIEIFTTGKMK